MAKKKSHEQIEVVPSVVSDESLDTTETQTVETTESVNPLMEEVQSFLNLRDELARKLALEIEATEQKLAELKSTAASLFPAESSDSSDERKAKKAKPKPVAREPKPAVVVPEESLAAAS